MDYYNFFRIRPEVLYDHPVYEDGPQSWCSWTTFDRMQRDSGYWTGPVRRRGDIEVSWIKDQSEWMQPFRFIDIFHVIVPAVFNFDAFKKGLVRQSRRQNIEKYSNLLLELGAHHKINELFLEIRVNHYGALR